MESLRAIQSIFANETVQYECDCGRKRPITMTYFCRYCLSLRCRACVSNEVDSQYCQHCLEYIPLMDGKLKKNKCAACFQCPCCFHTLSTRSFLEQVPSDKEPSQMMTKKVFTLVCCFCKWSSLDVGIPKQFVASGNWPEMPTPHAQIVDKRFEYFRFLAEKEKIDKDKKKSKRPVYTIDLLDRYGISASLSPRVNESLRSKLYLNRLSQGGQSNLLKEKESCPAVALSEVEPLDESVYYDETSEVQTTELSSIEQRLHQIELQPSSVSKFFPISKMLSVKRSLRCRQCEHNLIKSECNPCMIRLKIQLSAYYHIPEIKLNEMPNLVLGKETDVIITIKNPSSFKMRVNFLQSETKDKSVNTKVILPQNELLLMPKDDTIDLGIDQQEQIDFNDDLRVISRHGNKVSIRLSVVLMESTHKKIVANFKITHDFVTNILEKDGKKEIQLSLIKQNIFLNLGEIV